MLLVQWMRAASLRQIATHCLGHLRCMSPTGLLLVRAPWMGTRETSKRTATVLISNSHGQQLPPGDCHHSHSSKGKQMPLELINNCHPVMVTYILPPGNDHALSCKQGTGQREPVPLVVSNNSMAAGEDTMDKLPLMTEEAKTVHGVLS